MNVVKVSRKPWGSYCRFTCPGCRTWHVVEVHDAGDQGWSFNGDPERPTFSPSIRVRGVRNITDDEHARLMRGEHVEPTQFVCHSFVREGRIEFLPDCTHEMAGMTVDLPPIDTESP
jgi:Family of unknown function (DUF6527)